MAGEMHYGLADLYGPKMGFYQTNQQTIAEADDQDALIDEPELTSKNPHNVDPKQHKQIFISVGVALVLIFIFAVRF